MLVLVVSAGLLVLAVLVVWLRSSAQQWLLFLMPLCLRTVLTAGIAALAAAAFLPELLANRLFVRDVLGHLPWLPQHTGADFRLACAVVAFAIAAVGLPCLVGLDFARALAAHADWLKRLEVRLPGLAKAAPPATAPVPTAARPAAEQPRRIEQSRRSLDELLG